MYHLRSVAENVLQMLGVGGKLSEELPVAFDVVELLFGLLFRVRDRPCW